MCLFFKKAYFSNSYLTLWLYFSDAVDVRSASQEAEINALEKQLVDLVAKMNVKGKLCVGVVQFFDLNYS